MNEIEEIVEKLGLMRHPEGGYYRETFRDVDRDGRAISSAMLYLIKRPAPWHKIDASEVWHWYDGAPVELSYSQTEGKIIKQTLGNNIHDGELPQIVIPANAWQAAKSMGDWSLIGTTVAPGFEFDGHELALPGWTP
jgi:predicted cupin superfamily sugar epimerase